MEALNRILRAQAISHGLCKKWTEEWDLKSDTDKLLFKYKEGIGFCCKNNYPPNDFVKRHFDRAVLCEHHIYLDENIVYQDAPSDTYVIQGDSEIDLTFSGYTAAFLWLRNCCKVNITAKEHARIFVHVFDNSDCTITLQDKANVVTRKRSETANLILIEKKSQNEENQTQIFPLFL